LDGNSCGGETFVGWMVRIVEQRWLDSEDCRRATLDGENCEGTTLVGW